MELKQISVTLPNNLLKESQEYSDQYGYKNVQELMLDLLRQKVIIDKIERYKEIENRMKVGVGVKRFNKKDAVRHLRKL